MNAVNLGENYTHRVTLRLSDEQYNFLITVSKLLGVSPSDYMRMSINAGMISTKNTIDKMSSGNIMEGLVGTSANVKTDSNDFV